MHPASPATSGDRSVRQVRHLMQNALRRIVSDVAQDKMLRRSSSGRALASRLADRIMTASELADVLFGLTQAPGPMQARLEQLCEIVRRLTADADQLLELDVTVRGECPEAVAYAALRIACELVGNAIRHGMPGRMTGRIEVALDSDAGLTVLDVRDDGWGCQAHAVDGEGLALAVLFAGSLGGTVRLRRVGPMTVVTAELPHDVATATEAERLPVDLSGPRS